jgi:hypothetical protein
MSFLRALPISDAPSHEPADSFYKSHHMHALTLSGHTEKRRRVIPKGKLASFPPENMEPVASAKYCPSSTSLLLSSLPSSLLALLLLLLLVQLPSMATCHEEMKSIDVGQRVLPVRLGRPAFGPESLAFDHRGDGPYTGVSNGRVLRWRGARRGWTEFAHNYKHEYVHIRLACADITSASCTAGGTRAIALAYLLVLIVNQTGR